MASRVVCVSRTLGAGGEEVARLVADALGFRFVDDEIILRAAESAGVSPETVAQAESTPSLITRIVESLGKAPLADPGMMVLQPTPSSPSYTKLIERVIRQTADEGNVVIVAHGASIPLAGEDGVLRILVTASPEVRAQRLATNGAGDERAAKKAVEDSDRERGKFLQRFYGVNHEHPTHYDLTINTDAIGAPRVAQLVAQAARG
jgi:cytidylate kinase